MAEHAPPSITTKTVYTIEGPRFKLTKDFLDAEHRLRESKIRLESAEFRQNLIHLKKKMKQAKKLIDPNGYAYQLVKKGGFLDILEIMKRAAEKEKRVTVLLLWEFMSDSIAVLGAIASERTEKNWDKAVWGQLSAGEREERKFTILAAAQSLHRTQRELCGLLKKCIKFVMRAVSPEQVLGGVNISVLTKSTKQSDGTSSNSSIHQLTFHKDESDVEPELDYTKLKTRYGYGPGRDGPTYIYVPDDESRNSARLSRYATSVLNSNFRMESTWKQNTLAQMCAQLEDLKLLMEHPESSGERSMADQVMHSGICGNRIID